MGAPAAKGTADYLRRGRDTKRTCKSTIDRNTDGATKIPITRANETPTKIEPDKKSPGLHRMGQYTWNKQTRKLDALFAIYVMGWETKQNNYDKWRYWIKPLVDKESKAVKWESEMLPYFHDDIRFVYKGIAKLKTEGIYFVIESSITGYQVTEKNRKISVSDKDITFAIMAACLLTKGVSKQDIQSAINYQDDWTIKAIKRQR